MSNNADSLHFPEISEMNTFPFCRKNHSDQHIREDSRITDLAHVPSPAVYRGRTGLAGEARDREKASRICVLEAREPNT